MEGIILVLISFLLGTGLGLLFTYLFMDRKLTKANLEKGTAEEKLNLLQSMQSAIQDQFKGISSEALKQSHETFFQLAQATFEKYQVEAKGELEKKSESISTMLKPIRESLEKFDGRVQDLEKSRISAYSALRQQIESLVSDQRHLRKETTNLVKALRAPSMMGRWGEMQLKRVVEMAGMLEYCDFIEQALTTEEGSYRPDLIVKLPGGKNIVVDAKAPLKAYLEGIEEVSEEGKALKLKEHAQQVRHHITTLSRKSYWEQFQPTPEFVVMFLPGETFFSAALQQDPSLIEVGVDQKVIIATPTTLIALLRSVAYGWRQENVSENAERVSKLGRELYKRVSDMSDHWAKMGKSLGQAVQSYNRAVGSLESRVLPSARRFQDLEHLPDIESVNPIDHTPRALQSAETTQSIDT